MKGERKMQINKAKTAAIIVTVLLLASLAGYLRELAERGTFDFNDIVRKYESWVLDDRFMVMAHEREA